MIVIDMKMPERCYICPMVYMSADGKWLCKLKEYRGGIRSVDITRRERPDDCPMCEVRTIYQHPP